MMLVSQGADYTSLFHAFPYRTPISRSFTARELLDALAHEDESGYTHHLLRSASGADSSRAVSTAVPDGGRYSAASVSR